MKPTKLHKDGCVFTVWAPERRSMTLHLASDGSECVMQKDEYGYFRIDIPGIRVGDRYFYQPDGERKYPDPVSHFQPEGVHGPSEVVDHDSYVWGDAGWRGLSFKELIFYEVHIGAYTPEGNFESMISRLDELAALGINALELMPIAQCPGSRNWGYDGVYLYAVQNTYGGPEGLKRLVDACHQRGIAVYLDVVYNHLGREGNYLSFFGPYFSDKYHTPWGQALNFDGEWSDEVKEYIIGNVLYWAEQYHIDGLRLDAIHEMFDRNAVTIWDLLQERVREWEQRSGRRFYLVAESDLNSPRTVRSVEMGGQGFDAQWMDDFHHSLYVFLNPEGWAHYRDFGRPEQFAKAYTEGFVHAREYVHFRRRRHGSSSAGIPGERFVVFNQNHDLPGNRPDGRRLAALVDIERVKLAAAALLLSPYVPLLFMGEEYGEETPFHFFSDYSDADIISGLKEGRRQQFAGWGWSEDPPDPQDEAVFLASKLRWDERTKGQHAVILDWHRQLIRLRKEHPLLRDLSRQHLRADLVGDAGLVIYRYSADRQRQLLTLFNFSTEDLPVTIGYGYAPDLPVRNHLVWERLLGEPETVVPGGVLLPPWGVAVYDLNLSTGGT